MSLIPSFIRISSYLHCCLNYTDIDYTCITTAFFDFTYVKSIRVDYTCTCAENAVLDFTYVDNTCFDFTYITVFVLQVLKVSSKTGDGLGALWDYMTLYRTTMHESKQLISQRDRQVRTPTPPSSA